jgi:selenocysteine-specific elongation factor
MTHLTIATAGHIDHGKSTLVQALTGTNPDRLPEEQARGISIELGFAHTTVDAVTLSFVDVPGHERFVRTMLAGVGGIDAVLLVVAADESVMPQTREHFDICRLLDVPAGVIALTRCDLADEIMQEVAESDVRALVAGSALESAPLVRVSARTGEGIDALRQALVRVAVHRTRDADAPVRLPIDRAFSVKGFGTVVTGTLWSGAIASDSELVSWPAGQRVRVRGLQVHGAAADRAAAGQRVAVNLAAVSLTDIERGHVLLGDGAAISTRRVTVAVDVLPDAPPQKHGARLHVHLGTAVALGRLILPPPIEVGRDRVLAPGQRGPGVLRLESPLAARRGDRLVLRAYSPLATVAGAVVVDPQPPVRGLHHVGTPAGEVASLLLARVRESGALGCAAADLPARCGVTPATLQRVADDLATQGALAAVGSYWVAADVLPDLRDAVLRRLEAAEAADPMGGGVPRATLRALGGRRWRAEIVDLVIDRLAADGAITGDERLQRATAKPVGRDPADARVLVLVEASGLKGLTAGEIEAADDALDRRSVAAVLARLAKARDVDRVGDLYIASGRLADLAGELRRLAGTGEAPAVIEVGWFKERYGLTRRTAIPLLEWLDRTRVTRRQGDARVLIGTP